MNERMNEEKMNGQTDMFGWEGGMDGWMCNGCLGFNSCQFNITNQNSKGRRAADVRRSRSNKEVTFRVKVLCQRETFFSNVGPFAQNASPYSPYTVVCHPLYFDLYFNP